MAGGPSPEDSIPTLVARLADEGKAFARAEVAVVKARLEPRIADARNAAIFAVVAITLVHALVIAGLVGLILWLSHWLGTGGATATVVLVGLVAAGILGWLAYAAAMRAVGKAR